MLAQQMKRVIHAPDQNRHTALLQQGDIFAPRVKSAEIDAQPEQWSLLPEQAKQLYCIRRVGDILDSKAGLEKGLLQFFFD